MWSEISRKDGNVMAHTPYGYRIVNGLAIIDENEGKKIASLFEEYIIGKSMRDAAMKVGIAKTHSMIGRILKNRVYLGTNFYPQIIDEVTFNKAQEIRQENAITQNRIKPAVEEEPPVVPDEFHVGKIEKKYDDPYMQAEYAYSQIGVD